MRFPKNALVAVVLFIAMGPVSSSPAFAQVALSSEGSLPDAPVKKSQKIDLLFRASEGYLAAGTTFDMMTTANNLGHPTTASSSGGVFLTHYYAEENGWAGPIVGQRNTTGVVLANVGLNLGIDLLDRRLFKRGGKWRVAAISLNMLKGTASMFCGMNNIRTNEGVNKVVQMQTGYKGIVVWSR